MKHLTIVIVVFGVLLSSQVFAKTNVTVYCDDNYPPYSYVENGVVKGIYTTILSTAFSRMKDYNVVIKDTAWKRGLAKLEQGEYFAIFPPYYRPKTRLYMDYSEPILEEKLVVFVSDTISAKRILNNWPGDFFGLKIGKNHGFAISQNKTFLSAVESGKIIIEEAKDNRTNILKLGMGRIDAYVNDRLSILWELNRLKKSGEYDEGGKHSRVIEGPTISVENGYLGITNTDNGKYNFKKDFVNKLNNEIKSMKENGEIEKIVVGYYSN